MIRPLPLLFHRLCALPIAIFLLMIFPSRLGVALKNIRVAFPEKPWGWRVKIALGSLYYFAWCVWENLWLISLPSEKVAHCLDITPEEISFFNHNGAIIVTLHQGCWELGFLALQGRFKKAVTIFRQPKSEFGRQLIALIRQTYGAELISDKGALTQCIPLLRMNKHVFFVLDHHHSSSHAARVQFFGQPVQVAHGPAWVHQKTCVPIVISVGFRDWKTGRCRYHQQAMLTTQESQHMNSEQITQWCFSQFEEMVRLHPEQYWWFHRLFKLTQVYR